MPRKLCLAIPAELPVPRVPSVDLKQTSAEKQAPKSPRSAIRAELEAVKSKRTRENNELDEKHLGEAGGLVEPTEIEETRKRQKREKNELDEKHCREMEAVFAMVGAII